MQARGQRSSLVPGLPVPYHRLLKEVSNVGFLEIV